MIDEIERIRTADGKSITTKTPYNSHGGRPINQHITIRQPNGKVTATNVLKSKLLP